MLWSTSLDKTQSTERERGNTLGARSVKSYEKINTLRRSHLNDVKANCTVKVVYGPKGREG